MRTRKNFTRLEGNRSAKLIVIAAEGFETENIYFEAMKTSLKASNVHVEVLHRENDGESSPEHVYSRIKQFMEEYNIEDDDELWVVIDRDRWSPKMISSIAKCCAQNKNLRLCVSNPCFELWLLLHIEDVSLYSDENKRALSANRKCSRHKTLIKQKLSVLLNGYNEANYNVSSFLPYIDDAINRAAKLDINPEDRWPQTVGTRAYLLAKSIMGKE